MTHSKLSERLVRHAAALLLLLPVAAPAIGAQAAPAPDATISMDPRWRAWLGCWSPEDSIVISLSGRSSARSLVCVTPTTDGAGVDITSIVNGRAVGRERVVANGARIVRTRDGCPGWESARFSADGQRVLMRSEFTCNGSIPRRESGVFALTPGGEWLDLQGVDVMGSAGVRAMRYRDAGIEVAAIADTRLVTGGDPNPRVLRFRDGCEVIEHPTWNADHSRVSLQATTRCPDGSTRVALTEYARNVGGGWFAVNDSTARTPLPTPVGDSAILAFEAPTGYATLTARTHAAAPLSADDVLEVSKQVESPVAEAWLAESRPQLSLDAATLTRLADAGMSSRVIDLLVALAYPRTFAIAANSSDVSRVPRAGGGNGVVGPTFPVTAFGYPGAMFNNGFCNGYRNNFFNRRLDPSCFNMGYGYGLGWNNWGYGFGPSWYNGNNPVIIITNPGSGGGGGGGSTTTRGYAVPGRGYTRDPGAADRAMYPSTMGSSLDRSTRSSGGSSGGGIGGGSSGSSGGGGGGGGEGSTGRTAKARGG